VDSLVMSKERSFISTKVMFLSTQLLTAAIGISAFCAEVSGALLPERDGIPSLVYGRQESGNSSSSWPYGPFNTQGRDIVNTKGEAVTFAGINWPGSGESMVPEGIEWSSIEDILSQVQSVGFNFIRLTYAIEMVDQIYERNGSDVGLEITMINALGYENG
jgi:endoglucanase